MERITRELVDEIMYSYKNKIEEYVTYMEDLYVKGTFLMLDMTDEVENENLEYARRLGVLNGEELYYKFMEKYRIEEKSDILYALLLFYKQNGTFDCEEIKETALTIPGFWDGEYMRFVKAVEELFELQVSMDIQADDTLLTGDDIDRLYDKARNLGFYNMDYVKAVMEGNLVRLKNQ